MNQPYKSFSENNRIFFSKAEYDEHKKTFKHFGCSSCQIDFYTQAELRQHWDHDQSCNAFTCSNCGGGFSLVDCFYWSNNPYLTHFENLSKKIFDIGMATKKAETKNDHLE